MALQLYSFWRSSAAYRVRIALHHKGLPFATVAKHLVRDGGEQRKADYLAVNPQGLVPALADDGQVIPQSLAICEYLEETHPEPPLLPGSALDRAAIRSLALAVACDIHPLNNLSVTGYVRSQFGADDAAIHRWIAHWILGRVGQAVSALLEPPLLMRRIVEAAVFITNAQRGVLLLSEASELRISDRRVVVPRVPSLRLANRSPRAVITVQPRGKS